MNKPIKHLWLDFSETLAFIQKEEHNKLRYESYASVVGKPVTPELVEEFEALYIKHNKSNAAVFRSLGLSSNYWSERINSIDPQRFYKIADERIPEILEQLKEVVPVSLFSNIELGNVLPALNIKPEWFTHILSSGMVKEPKPALDGFYKLVELSGLPAGEVLYIGDDVGKDVVPAKKVGLQAGLMWKSDPEADYSFSNFGEVLELIKKQGWGS